MGRTLRDTRQKEWGTPAACYTGVVRLRGILRCCALAVGLRGGADAKGWPQPVLGTETTDIELLLTFDDGPNPLTTPAVLDFLKQRKIRAIFFVVGKQVVSKHKDVPA